MKQHFVPYRRFAVLLLALFLCVPLSSCRESPVLHEVRYEHTAPEVDPEQDMLDPEDDGAEDEQFDQEQNENAETKRDSMENMGVEDPSSADTEHSTEVNYSPESGNDWQSQNAPSGTAQSEGNSENAKVPSPSDSESENPENFPNNSDSLKQVVDGSGRTVTLPANVETVTAVRWAAQMVEMLGGSGRLLAADSDFLSSPLAKAAFSDLKDVSGLWTGSGNSGMTGDQFSLLLELAPDVCFEISGENTFTEAQIQQLDEAGITYVVLPALTSAEKLKQAVNLLGEILGTNVDTGVSSSGIAASYAKWVDGVVSDVKGKVPSDCISLYLSDWDSSTTYVLDHTKGVIESEGSGLAVAYSPKKAQLVSTFMKAAGVVNESTRIMSTHRDSEYVYVAPMFHQFDAVVSGRKATFYSGAGEYGSAYDLFVARMITDSSYYQLGGSQYPAVIAASESVREQVENDWFWQYHPSDSNGYITISGQSFYCGVIGPYSIYVNPQGMCDWAEGSVESPLEAYWVAYKFGSGFTLDDVKEKTNAFYQQFFGLTLTEKQLEGIFGE
ncbi:MAG: hypothetical protein ACI4O3_05765 [Oscillospiraceae bacterium]